MVISVFMACDFITYHITVHPKKYAHGSHSVVSLRFGMGQFCQYTSGLFPWHKGNIRIAYVALSTPERNISVLISLIIN